MTVQRLSDPPLAKDALGSWVAENLGDLGVPAPPGAPMPGGAETVFMQEMQFTHQSTTKLFA